MAEKSELTREILESHLKCPVVDFVVSQGSNTGDNYMGIILAVDVTILTDGVEQKRHLVCKCYPSHPTRQEFANKENIFYIEWQTYKEYIPALIKLKNQFMPNEPPLALAPLVGGEAVNYKTIDRSNWKKLYGTFENYIILSDVRKEMGYHMGDRTKGLSEPHMFLVVKELARLHAFSWAYKQTNNIPTILDHYPFLSMNMSQDNMDMFKNLLASNIQLAIETVQDSVSSQVVQGWERLKNGAADLMNMYFDTSLVAPLDKITRIPVQQKFKSSLDSIDTESVWSIVCHGDCWMNNMLFKTNEKNEPVGVILVDLQMCRETCPTLDLAYFIYSGCGLASARRKVIVDDLLQLYTDTFMGVCSAVGCEPLPGFSFEALKFRFYRMSLFGASLASILGPVMHLKADKAKDLDKEEHGQGDMGDMMKGVTDIVYDGGDNKFKTAMVELSVELYENGVF